MRAEPAARLLLVEQVLRPALDRLRAALPGPRDAVQDDGDLLEVRWLLSGQAGRSMGTVPLCTGWQQEACRWVQRPSAAARRDRSGGSGRPSATGAPGGPVLR